MNTIKEIFKNHFKDKLRSGEYFKASLGKSKAPLCSHCKKAKKETEVIRWGKQDPPIYEWRCDCMAELEKKTAQQIEVYNPQAEVDKLNVVAIVSGRAFYISEKEKMFVIESINQGKKIVMVRDYVFDRVYPMIPREEYEKQNYEL